jgi:hypothetical protein
MHLETAGLPVGGLALLQFVGTAEQYNAWTAALPYQRYATDLKLERITTPAVDDEGTVVPEPIVYIWTYGIRR